MNCDEIRYNVISSGSAGNAVILNEQIMIDCGVPFKYLKSSYKKLKLVLLTHVHSDHFRKSTIRTLATERPSLRFACGKWLAESLVSKGAKPQNIDVLDFDMQYDYGICKVTPVPLVHNVPNMGFKIHFPNGKRLIYATDTNNLNGIVAKDYDLYMIEANYEDEEIKARIDRKKADGSYAYEMDVIKNHLSKAKADDFIYKNIGPDGRYVYLHQHRDKKRFEGEVKH